MFFTSSVFLLKFLFQWHMSRVKISSVKEFILNKYQAITPNIVNNMHKGTNIKFKYNNERERKKRNGNSSFIIVWHNLTYVHSATSPFKVPLSPIYLIVNIKSNNKFRSFIKSHKPIDFTALLNHTYNK